MRINGSHSLRIAIVADLAVIGYGAARVVPALVTGETLVPALDLFAWAAFYALGLFLILSDRRLLFWWNVFYLAILVRNLFYNPVMPLVAFLIAAAFVAMVGLRFGRAGKNLAAAH